jgi:hypothetical protein
MSLPKHRKHREPSVSTFPVFDSKAVGVLFNGFCFRLYFTIRGRLKKPFTRTPSPIDRSSGSFHLTALNCSTYAPSTLQETRNQHLTGILILPQNRAILRAAPFSLSSRKNPGIASITAPEKFLRNDCSADPNELAPLRLPFCVTLATGCIA